MMMLYIENYIHVLLLQKYSDLRIDPKLFLFGAFGIRQEFSQANIG
jgi:hypothetical protein